MLQKHHAYQSIKSIKSRNYYFSKLDLTIMEIKIIFEFKPNIIFI